MTIGGRMLRFKASGFTLSVLGVGAVLALASTPAFAQTPPQAPAPGTGTGLWGEYFDNYNFTGNKPTRLDPTIDFQSFQPQAIGTPTGLPTGMTDHNQYVIRWQGLVEVPAGVTSINFHMRADDGCRLWVDGILVVDDWRQGGIQARGAGAPNVATVAVNPGELHTIRAEMYEEGGGDGAGLDWDYTGQVAIAVPTANLYPQVAYPRFLLAPGSYSDTQVVRLVCDTIGTDVVLRYTTDGTNMATATDGLPYTGPIILSSTATVKARAFRASMPGNTSIQTQATYTITDTTAPQLLSIKTLAAQQLVLTFSEPMNAAAAATAANYTLNLAATVTTAVVQPNPNLVVLTTTGLVSGTNFVLTLPNGLADRSGVAANALPAGYARVFTHLVPSTANLVDWYRFDEGTGTAAADSSGSAVGGNAGTVEPTAVEPPAWVEGYVGTALYFNGINNAVVTSAALDPVLGNTCSISCWLKTQLKGFTSTTDVLGIVGVNDGTANMDIKYGFFNGSGQIAASTRDGAQATAGIAVNDDQWHHLVITRDASTGTLTIYIDAVQRSQVTSGTGATSTLSFNKIGAILGTAATVHRYLGVLDEVKFYNAVLTQNDVYDLYNQPPSVIAGPNQLLPAGILSANLNGTGIQDDGYPAPSNITWTWTQISGPAGVVFGAASGTGNNANTTATFPGVGTYILRLTASDGSLSSSADVTIDVPQIAVSNPVSATTAENPAAPNHSTTFTITFASSPTSNVSLTITSSKPGEALLTMPNPPAPYTAVTTGTATINITILAGAPAPTFTIVITGQQDFVDDGDQPYTVTVTGSSAEASMNVSRVLNLTNLDMDTAGVIITPPAGGWTVDEDPLSPIHFITFNVRLATIPTSNVTITFSQPQDVLGIQAFVGNPATVPPARLPLPPSYSITFLANDPNDLIDVPVRITAYVDSDIELTRSYPMVVTLTIPGGGDANYGPINPPDQTITVLDNNPIPALPKVWGCGLSGLEILLPLGLAAFWRRRRRA